MTNLDVHRQLNAITGEINRLLSSKPKTLRIRRERDLEVARLSARAAILREKKSCILGAP
jgi:hypothetical protein